MAKAAGSRWTMEECFEMAKGEKCRLSGIIIEPVSPGKPRVIQLSYHANSNLIVNV